MSDRDDLAAQVLDLVRYAAGSRTEAEVTVYRAHLGLTRFANSYIHQNLADTTTTVRLRLHRDGRTAAGSTTLTVPDALGDLVDRTLSAARLCPPDPGWPGLAPPASVPDAVPVDPRIVDGSPADRAAQVRAFVDAAGGLLTAGYARTHHWQLTVANSAGQSARGEVTEAALDAIARTDTADGTARVGAGRLSDVDGSRLGARAAAKAMASADPVELPPGRYEVVLEPAAVDDVLLMLAVYGFSGKALAERRSFVELGVPQFDDLITLVDDPTRPGAVGLPFDSEGTPRGRLELVRAGVTNAVTYDRRTAAENGAESTGHATGDGWWGPIAANLLLRPGGEGTTATEVPGPPADSSVAELVSRVGRGVLVSDHWYTRVLDPKSLVVTGLTRNGVWLIEDGELVRPVANLRFTQSYPQALAPGSVLGVGTSISSLPAELGGCVAAPALHLGSWNFTGGRSG